MPQFFQRSHKADSGGFWRYPTAFMSVVVSVIVSLALDSVFRSPYVPIVLLIAVVVAARIGGRGPAAFASILSILSIWYFFLEPRFSLAIVSPADIGILAAFGAVSGAISLSDLHSDKGEGASLRWIVLLGGAFITTIILTSLLFADFARERDRQHWVEHSYQVLNEIQALRSALQDAENAQRSYLLSGEESYLQLSQTAFRDQQSSRKTLRQLTADSPVQQTHLDALDRLVKAKFDVIRQTISLRRDGDSDAALALVKTDRGKRIMDQCRAVLHDMQENDRHLLAERTQAAEAQALRTHWVLGLGSGSLLLLLFIAGAVIERDNRIREQTTRALNESEARLHLALDSATAGAWEWNIETGENIWSEELWKVYGIEPHSCKPSYPVWRDMIHPDDRAQAERVVAEAARNGTELYSEFRVLDRDGSVRWLLARGQPQPDSLQRVSSYIGIALDITQRKQAEQAIRERERVLRRFTEVAPVAIAMFDSEMRYLAVSRRFRDDYDLGTQELAGRSHYEIFPELPQAWLDIHRRCLDGATESNSGEAFLRSDGCQQWIRWEIQPWRRSDGAVGGIVLFSEDITQQKHSEKALQESESRFRTMGDNLPDGAIYRYHRDPYGTARIDFISSGIEKLTGVPAAEFMANATTVDRNIVPEDLDRLNAAIDLSAEQLTRFEAEVRHRHRATGEIRWSLMRSMPFRLPDGSVIWDGVELDITDRKQAEERIQQLNAELEDRVRERTAQLAAANEELEAFAYSVSHDLRAPLRGIDGWSLALLEDYGGQLDSRAMKYLQRVRSETQRMGQLIDDLLQLSRITRADMQTTAIDLSALANAVAGRLCDTMLDRKIEFVVHPGLTTSADPRLLDVVLVNLFGNAIKFTGRREDARIEFGQTDAGSERIFFVKDNGVGFDMGYASMLFGAFQRLHKTTEFPGTGIGLATVQRVIHRHGGRIWAEAQPDQGATFYFTLPPNQKETGAEMTV